MNLSGVGLIGRRCATCAGTGWETPPALCAEDSPGKHCETCEGEGQLIPVSQHRGAVAIVEAAKALNWNAVDGSDEHSDVIVEHDSWITLRHALGGGKTTRPANREPSR